MSIGGKTSAKTTGENKVAKQKGKTTEKLNLNQDAINKIIEDLLGGTDGLASIFSGEQTAGIFDSTVAAQQAGNFTADVVGELAKLTAEREVNTTNKVDERSRTNEFSASVEGSFGL